VCIVNGRSMPWRGIVSHAGCARRPALVVSQWHISLSAVELCYVVGICYAVCCCAVLCVECCVVCFLGMQWSVSAARLTSARRVCVEYVRRWLDHLCMERTPTRPDSRPTVVEQASCQAIEYTLSYKNDVSNTPAYCACNVARVCELLQLQQYDVTETSNP